MRKELLKCCKLYSVRDIVDLTSEQNTIMYLIDLIFIIYDYKYVKTIKKELNNITLNINKNDKFAFINLLEKTYNKFKNENASLTIIL
jgi:hypothetical protein